MYWPLWYTALCFHCAVLAFYSQQRPFCGIWRSKNGLRMLSMAKRLGSMSLNSPIVKQGCRKVWKSGGSLKCGFLKKSFITKARSLQYIVQRCILTKWTSIWNVIWIIISKYLAFYHLHLTAFFLEDYCIQHWLFWYMDCE